MPLYVHHDAILPEGYVQKRSAIIPKETTCGWKGHSSKNYIVVKAHEHRPHESNNSEW